MPAATNKCGAKTTKVDKSSAWVVVVIKYMHACIYCRVRTMFVMYTKKPVIVTTYHDLDKLVLASLQA